MNECRHLNDWLEWKEAIKTELRSLAFILTNRFDRELLDIDGSLYETKMRIMK